MKCDDQHIAHNEVLAKILDLLCHLVNYGYYDDQEDIDELLTPLFELLDGRKEACDGKPTTLSTRMCTAKLRTIFM